LTRLPLTARYGLVSGLCLLAHNIIMVVADWLRLALPLGLIASFGLVVAIGYILHGRYTFIALHSWEGLARYAAAMAASLPLSTGLIWIFSRVLCWPMPIAAPTATFAMLAVNFTTSRWAIRGHGSDGAGSEAW